MVSLNDALKIAKKEFPKLKSSSYFIYGDYYWLSAGDPMYRIAVNTNDGSVHFFDYGVYCLKHAFPPQEENAWMDFINTDEFVKAMHNSKPL